jgi:hypothetical protein
MITDIQLKNAKPKEKNYTIKVDRGLSLLIKSSGSKLWRFRYSHFGKRSLISVGQYPQVTMRQARDRLQEYLDMLSQGVNPSAHKRELLDEKKAEKSFKDVAYEWHKKEYQDKSERYCVFLRT